MRQETRLKPANQLRIYKRNLPHYEIPGSVYFITFRVANDFRLHDQAKEITLESIKFHASKKYRLHAYVIMDTHVHIILQPLEAQAQRPVPPHDEASFKPGEDPSSVYSLAQIMHSIKSYSANRIQKLLNWQGGSVWMDESYDRVVRNDAEFVEKMSYIIYNPVKSGFVRKPEDYRWLYVHDGSEILEEKSVIHDD